MVHALQRWRYTTSLREQLSSLAERCCLPLMRTRHWQNREMLTSPQTWTCSA